MQAALLTSAALTAEVDALKKSLERSENELGLAKKQLEDKDSRNREDGEERGGSADGV